MDQTPVADSAPDGPDTPQPNPDPSDPRLRHHQLDGALTYRPVDVIDPALYARLLNSEEII